MLKKYLILALFSLFSVLTLLSCPNSPSSTPSPGTNGPATYTVTYNGNGSTSGTVPVDGNLYSKNQTVTVLGNTGGLMDTGYIFNGWSTNASGTGTIYAPGQTFSIKTNVIFYAYWEPTYSITYNGNGSSGGTVPSDPNIYTNGQSGIVFGNTGALINGGKAFNGWNTAANGSGNTYGQGATIVMSASKLHSMPCGHQAPHIQLLIMATEVPAGQFQSILLTTSQARKLQHCPIPAILPKAALFSPDGIH